MPATLDFFGGSLPAAFDKVPNNRDKELFRENNAPIRRASKKHCAR
jgi:hypothetical protein